MHCARGHLVKLVRLVYGHSATTGRCHYLPADCVTHLVASGNEVTCVGLNRCDVYVTSRDHGRPIPGCQLPTNYIHALFQCIPGMRKASQLTIKPIRYSSSSSSSSFVCSKQVHRRRYESRRSPKPNCIRKTKKYVLWNIGICFIADRNFSMKNCFPMKNFTEIGQSAAKLWPKTIFKMAGVRHLEFIKC